MLNQPKLGSNSFWLEPSFGWLSMARVTVRVTVRELELQLQLELQLELELQLQLEDST